MIQSLRFAGQRLAPLGQGIVQRVAALAAAAMILAPTARAEASTATVQASPSAATAIETWTLGDGTTVLLLEDHRAPLVELTIDFAVGSWSPWARQNHAEEAFEIQTFDPQRALQARADRLSVELSAVMNERSSTIRGSCLSDDLPELVSLMRAVLSNSVFDAAELVRWRKTRRIGWESRKKDPRFRLRQAAARLLFGEADPRRRAVDPPDDVQTDTTKLVSARDTLVRLPGRVIAVAGDISRQRLEPLIAGLLPPPIADAGQVADPRSGGPAEASDPGISGAGACQRPAWIRSSDRSLPVPRAPSSRRSRCPG